MSTRFHCVNDFNVAVVIMQRDQFKYSGVRIKPEGKIRCGWSSSNGPEMSGASKAARMSFSLMPCLRADCRMITTLLTTEPMLAG